MVKYILETDKIDDKEHFFEALTTHLSKQTGEEIMTIAETLRQEGRQEERQKVVLAMLERDLPIEQIAEITNLSAEAIKELEIKQREH